MRWSVLKSFLWVNICWGSKIMEVKLFFLRAQHFGDFSEVNKVLSGGTLWILLNLYL